ncbi:MAG: topoisomerase DNA-binding C4 zinc finger domain-containing protein [Methanobrevibacter sp.]|nr:topoisomerase DNA-binding C4 zinc finger domain-containing protein [Methanobrevibacter sp.]
MQEYEFEETKLRCPKCEKGKVRLVISRKEGKEYKFFRCSEYDCDWNGGFYNQDNNKIDIIDNCPSCDGILYVRNGKKGPFLGCSHFPKCKQTRDLTDEEAKLLESKTEKNLDNFVEESKDSPQEKDADLNDASHQIFDDSQKENSNDTKQENSKDSKKENSDDSQKEEPVYERIRTDLKCPECEKGDVILVIKTTQDKETKFFRCSEDDCHWNGGFYNRDEIKTDVLEHCPNCKGILYEKIGRKGPFMACSNFPKCKYTRNIEKSSEEVLEIREDIENSEQFDISPMENIETPQDNPSNTTDIETQEDNSIAEELMETPQEYSETITENVETPEIIQESSEEAEEGESHKEEKPKAEYERFETKLLCPECMEGQVILIRNMDTGKGFFRCTNNDCDWDGGPYSQPLKQLKHITYCKEPGCKGINYHTEGKFGPYKACTWFSKTGCRPKKKR